MPHKADSVKLAVAEAMKSGLRQAMPGLPPGTETQVLLDTDTQTGVQMELEIIIGVRVPGAETTRYFTARLREYTAHRSDYLGR